jgi:DNA-binding NarL/FixJ family response regulator
LAITISQSEKHHPHSRGIPSSQGGGARVTYCNNSRWSILAQRAVTTLFILRHEAEAARRLGAWLSLVPKFTVAATASSMAKALEALPLTNPDVLVTDLQLPDGAARDLVRALRRAGNRHRPRVLLLTQRDDDPQLLDALRAGGDSYFVEGRPGASMERDIASTARGESAMSAWIASQVLEFFRALAAAEAGDPVAAAQNSLHPSDYERVLLTLLAQGWTIEDVARHQDCSAQSVVKRLHAVYRKLQWDEQAGGLSLVA